MRVLLTAFEPYDTWEQNSSWEALVTFLHHRGLPEGVTTRRYPVDLLQLQARLEKDLAVGFDAIVHMARAKPSHADLFLNTISKEALRFIETVERPTFPRTFETPHPYPPDNCEQGEVIIPGALILKVCFDERSATLGSEDCLQIYDGACM